MKEKEATKWRQPKKRETIKKKDRKLQNKTIEVLYKKNDEKKLNLYYNEPK